MTPKTSRLGPAIWAGAVAVTVLLLAGSIWWRAGALRQRAIDFWVRPVASTASVMRTTIERWILERRRDAEAAARVAEAYTVIGPPSTSEQRLVTALGAIARAGDFQGIWYIDGTGRILASSPDAGQLPASAASLLPAIHATDSSMVHGPVRGAGGEYDLLFVAPVTSSNPGDGPSRTGGAVVLRADPYPYLFPIVSSPPISSSSGRSVLAAREDGRVTVIAPLAVPPTEPLGRSVPWNEAPAGVRAALEGRTDWVLAEDLRGEMVLAVPRIIPSTGWGLVRQLDANDVFAASTRQFRLEILALLTGLIALISVILIVRRALRIERLQRELVGLELDLLKSQLQPHFLFNALNAIAEQVHLDADKAEGMIVRLGDLLRMSLEMGKRQEVRLREEMGFLDTYLEIERTRLAQGLTVDKDIQGAVLDAMVPALVLQPLVENAIRHGVARSPGPGLVRIRARQRDDRLQLVVEDNGAGLDSTSGEHRMGVGVGNTLLRLQQLYGDDCRLELASRDEGGTVATIEFPLDFEAEAARGDWVVWPRRRAAARRAARFARDRGA